MEQNCRKFQDSYKTILAQNTENLKTSSERVFQNKKNLETSSPRLRLATDSSMVESQLVPTVFNIDSNIDRYDKVKTLGDGWIL